MHVPKCWHGGGSRVAIGESSSQRIHGEGFWPFFHPIVLQEADGLHQSLAEDWAFSHRLGQIGSTPLADTTIRLFHVGSRACTWEDTALTNARYESFTFNFAGREEMPRMF